MRSLAASDLWPRRHAFLTPRGDDDMLAAPLPRDTMRARASRHDRCARIDARESNISTESIARDRCDKRHAISAGRRCADIEFLPSAWPASAATFWVIAPRHERFYEALLVAHSGLAMMMPSGPTRRISRCHSAAGARAAGRHRREILKFQHASANRARAADFHGRRRGGVDGSRAAQV